MIQYSGRLAVSAIVLGELYAGADMLPNPTNILAGISDLLTDPVVLPFDGQGAEEFGKLRGILKQKGSPVNPIDLQIAAVALVHGLTLVTHDTMDFTNIPGLVLDDWLAP